MKALRGSPLSPLLVASALHAFIFCCCELPVAAGALLDDRQVFMKALRGSP